MDRVLVRLRPEARSLSTLMVHLRVLELVVQRLAGLVHLERVQ